MTRGEYEHNRHLGKFEDDIKGHENPQPEEDDDAGRLSVHNVPKTFYVWLINILKGIVVTELTI